MNPNMMVPRPPATGAQQQQQPRFTLSDTERMTCPKCGSDRFYSMYFLRRLSRLLTGEPKDTMITVPAFACLKCDEPFNEMLPDELRDDKIQKAV